MKLQLTVTLLVLAGLGYYGYRSEKKRECRQLRYDAYTNLLISVKEREAECDAVPGDKKYDCDNALINGVDESEKVIEALLIKEGCTRD